MPVENNQGSSDIANQRSQTINGWIQCSDAKHRPAGTQFPSHFPKEFKRNADIWSTIMKPIKVTIPEPWEAVTDQIIDVPASQFVEVGTLSN
jgi:hypothetical protein